MPAPGVLYPSAKGDISAALPARSSRHASDGAVLRHIPALDGLRGMAVVFVMLYHFGTELRAQGRYCAICRPFNSGWIGVDLFFALSGFLITGILLETRSSGNYFRNFYARRGLRVFPLYFSVLAIIAALCFASQRVANWVGLGPLALGWYWTYCSNILISMRGNWIGPLDHFWSLAVEEHFYLFWPIVVLLLNRRQLIVVCSILIAGALALRWVLTAAGASPTAVYVLTPCRIDALAVGGLVALLLRGSTGRRLLSASAWAVTLLSLTALAGVAWYGHGFNCGIPCVARVGLTLIAFLFAAVVALAALGGNWFSSLMEWSVLRFFGTYSYGLYVFHPLLGVFRRWLFHSWHSGPNLTFAACYLTVAMVTALIPATLSWHFLEKPVLGLRRYFRPSQPPAPVGK